MRRTRGDRAGAARGGRRCAIAVPLLPHIANFDDLDPLRAEPDVELLLRARPASRSRRRCDLVILAGAKATLADLAALRAEGWDIDLLAHVAAAGACSASAAATRCWGGASPTRTASRARRGRRPGSGCSTSRPCSPARSGCGRSRATLAERARRSPATRCTWASTEGPDTARPFARIGGRADGAVSADGRVAGTYVHGLFGHDAARAALLGTRGDLAYEAGVEAALDALAAHLEAHVEIDRLLALAG